MLALRGGLQGLKSILGSGGGIAGAHAALGWSALPALALQASHLESKRLQQDASLDLRPNTIPAGSLEPLPPPAAPIKMGRQGGL